MRRYQRLAGDDGVLRRAIADALEVLRTLPDFTEKSRSEIRVHPLSLPSNEIVGLVNVEFKVPCLRVDGTSLRAVHTQNSKR